MRILVLTKRQYMGKDLLDDRFGRFRELPLGLARLGHDIQGIALSYRSKSEGHVTDADLSKHYGVEWHSINLRSAFTPRAGSYIARARDITRHFRPDLIWAGSDVYHAIFGAWFANRARIPCIIDLYDNFEAFRASKLPFVLPLFRRAVKEAQGLTCFSQRLSDYVVDAYQRTKPTRVIENGVTLENFQPLNQQECRRKLKLPGHAKVIGTAGALDSSRGIETLFQAYELLAKNDRDIHLALAGPRGRRLKVPSGPKVHDLGMLPYDTVPTFINALDVSVVCYRHSAQGEYSLPQKAYEIIACRTPLIAARVGGMNELLGDYPSCFYEPGNPASLAAAAQRQLRDKIIVGRKIPSWLDSAKRLECFLTEVASE